MGGAHEILYKLIEYFRRMCKPTVIIWPNGVPVFLSDFDIPLLIRS